MVTNKEIDKLILALYVKFKINVQVVRATRYNPKQKKVFNTYTIEYLKQKKIPNEEGKNKVVLCKYDSMTEKVKGFSDVYKRLVEIYQENVERQRDG